MTFSFFARTRTAGVSVCTCANFGTRGPSAAQFRARQRHLRYNLATFGSCQMSVYNWPKSEHRRSKYQSKSSKPSLIFHTFLAALILFFNLFSLSTLFLFNIPPTLLSEYRTSMRIDDSIVASCRKCIQCRQCTQWTVPLVLPASSVRTVLLGRLVPSVPWGAHT